MQEWCYNAPSVSNMDSVTVERLLVMCRCRQCRTILLSLEVISCDSSAVQGDFCKSRS